MSVSDHYGHLLASCLAGAGCVQSYGLEFRQNRFFSPVAESFSTHFVWTDPSASAREALNKSHMSRVAGKIEMIARSATQVVAGPTMPRRATKRALDLHSGRGFAGDSPCRSICEGNDRSLHLASRVSSRKAGRHGHAGLVQGFPNACCRPGASGYAVRVPLSKSMHCSPILRRSCAMPFHEMGRITNGLSRTSLHAAMSEWMTAKRGFRYLSNSHAAPGKTSWLGQG